MKEVNYLIICMFMLASCNLRQPSKKCNVSNPDTVYNTTGEREGAYSVFTYYPDCKMKSLRAYNSENKLILTEERCGSRHTDTKINDSLTTITEYLLKDTFKWRDSLVVSRLIYINNKNDTDCYKSRYYHLRKIDNNKLRIQCLIHIPCNGYFGEEGVRSVFEFEVTDRKKTFNLYTANDSNGVMLIDIGEFRPGKYELFGKIMVLKEIKGEKDQYNLKTMYVDEEFIVR